MPKNLTFVVLEITPGNTMPDPQPARCRPGDKLFFVVTNDDATAHWVSIDPVDFAVKEDGTAASPIDAGKKMVKVNPGETDIIKHKVLPAASFGKTRALQFTTYKYIVRWADDQAQTVNKKKLDPDVDVTPP